jgi:site-specific recombinase
MFHTILDNLSHAPADTIDLRYLIELLAAVRFAPRAPNKADTPESRLRQLIVYLQENPRVSEVLRAYIERLLQSAHHLPLYAESGIQSPHGLFTEAFQKITKFILPPLYDADNLRGLAKLVFNDKKSFKWFCALPDETLMDFLDALGFGAPQSEVDIDSGSYDKLLNGILTLSYKLAAMGTESDILMRLPHARRHESESIIVNSLPFLEQNKELVRYVERVRETGEHPTKAKSMDAQHALVMLTQCEEAVAYIRRNRHVYGTSLRLTYQLQRIVQHIKRLQTLIHISFKPSFEAPRETQRYLVRLWKEVVEAENTEHNLWKHFSQNTELLAFQIAENAAKTGERYITTTRAEFIHFFTSSMGGGFIVAFLACLKLWISKAHFPPFGEAFFYSLNYAVGFILIHILGYKLATKQPAMTASAIADSLDARKKSASDNAVSLQNLVVTIAKISRTQLISFAGNVFVAFPVGCFLTTLYFFIAYAPMATPEKAEYILHELDPFTSLALFHAGIAGVFLFLSGLLSGYYDNSVVFNKIPERLRRHPFLRRILSQRRLDGFARYVENNLGALAGNFFLGVMLGTASNIGFILGLPIDIRHITFAAANFSIALISLLFAGKTVSLSVALVSALGIIGIGAMNFFVSFGLALLVAIRSRNVNFQQTGELLRLLWIYFRSNTREFFFPPKNAEK